MDEGGVVLMIRYCHLFALTSRLEYLQLFLCVLPSIYVCDPVLL